MEQIQFISTSPTALVNLIDEVVKVQLEELKKNFEPKTPTEYLTRQETADLLKVDLSTIWNYTKKGFLQSHGIGSRVYYKREEVENAIIELKK